jgi:hypothetical protein
VHRLNGLDHPRLLGYALLFTGVSDPIQQEKVTLK